MNKTPSSGVDRELYAGPGRRGGAGEGEKVWWIEGTVAVKVTAAESGGSLGAWEFDAGRHGGEILGPRQRSNNGPSAPTSSVRRTRVRTYLPI